ncbi:MAG TPA: Fe-S oxidoreductase, partial [Chitinophagaceae bacterium]|nr:Fe-S oxidoreductase [Chitinophagaceae bacterium]
GSCTLHIKEHLHVRDTTLQHNIRKHVYELNEFIVDVLGVKKIKATFPYKVGYHASCHGQRGLHLSSMSELMVAA